MKLFLLHTRELLIELYLFHLAMFSRFRNALFNVVGGFEPLPVLKAGESSPGEVAVKDKFVYSRPDFLQLNGEEEVQASADHKLRPIILPRDNSRLPWNSGYAEAVNAGKSVWNEDQASVRICTLERSDDQIKHAGEASINVQIPSTSANNGHSAANSLNYVYFGIFDGHAGFGAALAAAHQLHYIIHEKLVDVIDHLIPPLEGPIEMDSISKRGSAFYIPSRDVAIESLIVGALESAFNEMDNLIGNEKMRFQLKGGCTALVALFILGKLYVANAGDSRAVLCLNKTAHPVSSDFTPESERLRIRQLAALKPELLGGEFTHLDYLRRPTASDLGKRILYRDAYMTGWAYKTVTTEDLKYPVVYGEGKRSRVLSTIGVTRGFGDHDLKAVNTQVKVKPFLLSQPEVQIFDLKKEQVSGTDVLIMGTDGLWDVTSNEKAVEIVMKSLSTFPANDISRMKRFTSAAQNLVSYARGKPDSNGIWRADGKSATVDDISVFVIPLTKYRKEYMHWLQECETIRGIYDTPNETGEEFGKLSLKTSPISVKKTVWVPSSVSHSTTEKQVKKITKCASSEKLEQTSETQKSTRTNISSSDVILRKDEESSEEDEDLIKVKLVPKEVNNVEDEDKTSSLKAEVHKDKE